ncbi:hypothetical protein FLK61_26535 [Paenalkalicoccus suaedae]|uniref:Uncharacterized protein n=2 Tax=Paenalkalicoccus suaedae TaxID=2592382 RepID=A0A859FAP0_9BACI|nr:hypothetical protein FLK61_26535 [Paenalkalicoccus suaedae]
MLALLLIADYFAQVSVPVSILIFVLVVSLIISVIAGWGNTLNPMKECYLSISISLGLVAFLGILTLLGGESTVGLRVDHPLIWLIVFTTLISNSYKIIKLKRIEATE